MPSVVLLDMLPSVPQIKEVTEGNLGVGAKHRSLLSAVIRLCAFFIILLFAICDNRAQILNVPAILAKSTLEESKSSWVVVNEMVYKFFLPLSATRIW